MPTTLIMPPCGFPVKGIHMEYSAEFIKNILARHGKILKRSLGQNFLFEKKILDAIIEASVENKNENIIEIGAGVGFLTDLLCKNSKKVVTIEIDDTLPPLLSETVPHPNFFLHLEDVLKVDFNALAKEHFSGERFVIVGNLPYYITAKILDRLTQHLQLFDRAVIMVQKEVAERLQSAPGSKEYRAATVTVQSLFDVDYICTVPPHCFVPAPHIESAVISLTPKENSGILPEDIPAFLSFVSCAFASRRKQLKGLSATLGSTSDNIASALVAIGFSETARAEELTPKDIIKLFYLLQKSYVK